MCESSRREGQWHSKGEETVCEAPRDKPRFDLVHWGDVLQATV